MFSDPSSNKSNVYERDWSTFDQVNPFMRNVVKWPTYFKNLVVFTPQDFIVFLAILQHYA